MFHSFSGPCFSSNGIHILRQFFNRKFYSVCMSECVRPKAFEAGTERVT